MVEMSDALVGYRAALEGAVYYPLLDAGYLRLAGPDRVDFLQRQTTNDIRNLTAYRSVTTVLTSPTARILDVLTLTPDVDALGVITLPGRGSATLQFLHSRIFFKDRVTLTDASQDIAQIDLEGARVAEALIQLGIDIPTPDAIDETKLENLPLRVIARQELTGPACRVLAPSSHLGDVMRLLENAGLQPLSSPSREVLRIEAVQPGSAAELIGEYTPLEVGLNGLISDTKGCYTGQEVIARQISYDKVTRHLVGISLTEPAPVGSVVEAEGKVAGKITSVAVSPRFGPIALGVLKRPWHVPGTELLISDGERRIRAQVRS